MAELERLHRLELELRRQLKDRDRVIDDLVPILQNVVFVTKTL